MAYSYDDRDREFRQSPPPRPPRKEDNDLGSWILIIFLFIVAWPPEVWACCWPEAS